MNPQQYYLMHDGILGMKWGQRRYQNKDGTLTEEGKRRKAEQRRAASETRKKREESDKKKQAEITALQKRNTATMTDEELRTKVNRLQLEKQYRDLLPKQEVQVSAGQKFVKDVLGTAGKAVATTLITGGALYLGRQALAKMTNEETAKQVYNYGKAGSKK